MTENGLDDFIVDERKSKDIPLIPVPENPRYILIAGRETYSGETIVSGFISSDILNIIKAREGFMRGDLRRFTGDGYAFTTFRTVLSPYNIIQLLKYFGYGVITVCSPPSSPIHGHWRTMWTLESGRKVPLTKTYLALVKLILEEGWEIGKDQRIVGRRLEPEIDLKVTTGELHLRVVNYMLMTYFKHGDIYEENYENVRDFLDNLREKTNRNFFNLTDIWATSKNRDAFVRQVMQPQTSRIPEQCILPNMGVKRNVLMRQPAEWYDYGPDGKPPPPRMTMTQAQREHYANLYINEVKSLVELDVIGPDESGLDIKNTLSQEDDIFEEKLKDKPPQEQEKVDSTKKTSKGDEHKQKRK